MEKILVIGASSFIGKHVAQALLVDGLLVRCLVRTPARVHDLATAGCEIVQGDDWRSHADTNRLASTTSALSPDSRTGIKAERISFELKRRPEA